MRKLTARWVPKSLSDEQMTTRASVCSALLKRFRSKDDFLLRLVTVDETWVHYYEPENKAQSRQWVGPGSPRPKKFKTQPSAGKVMATVFWDAKGVIMLDFLPKRSRITGVYYANLLDQLRTAIHEKRWGKLSKGVLGLGRAAVCDCGTPLTFLLPFFFAATGQRESPHLQSCNGCCRAKRVWINTTSCLFAWPSS